MRILIISQWAHPEPNALSSVYAREWASRGHDVTLLTGFPNYPTGRIYPSYKLRFLSRETRDNVTYLRCWLYPDHGRSGWKRIVNYCSFALSAALIGCFKANRPDVIWAYHPPMTVGLVAYVLSRRWRCRSVFAVHDLWPEGVHASGMVQSAVALRLLDWLARFVYSVSDAITIVSPAYRHSLNTRGVPSGKVTTIYNFSDSSLYFPRRPSPEAIDRYGFEHPFKIVFAGNIGLFQRLDTVVECARLLADHPELGFYVFGDGTDREPLAKKATELKLTNIRFPGRIEERFMPEIFSVSDALLLQLDDTPLFRMTIPSKLQTYMASGKPVLCGAPGEASALVLAADAGITYNPLDPSSLKSAVLSMLNLSDGARNALGANARRFFLENFTLELIASRHLAVLERLREAKDDHA